MKSNHLVLVYLNDIKDVSRSQTAEDIFLSVINHAKKITKFSGEWQAYKWRITDSGCDNNVILGSQNPDKLISLICEYKDIPIKTATNLLQQSGYQNQIVNANTLNNCLEKKPNEAQLAKALRLALGEYFFESQFFNTHSISSILTEEELLEIRTNPSEYAAAQFEYHI